MVIYSGFSTRKQEDRYNQLLKDLLRLLSQMIISYIDTIKVNTFKHAYEKIQIQFMRMDQQKYSDFKVSNEIDTLTRHIFNQDYIKQTYSEPPKKKTDVRAAFRMKRSNHEHTPAKTIQFEGSQQWQDRKRSFSNTIEKNGHRYSEQLRQNQELTMQDLMRMNPLIQKKMSAYRNRRPPQTSKNDFPQIKQQDFQGEDI